MTHPVETARVVGNVLLHPVDSARKVGSAGKAVYQGAKDGIRNWYKALTSDDPGAAGKAWGQANFEVFTSVAPVGKAVSLAGKTKMAVKGGKLKTAIGAGNRAKKITKAESPVWKKLKNYKDGIRMTGEGKKRRYYDWDHTHGDIEVYDHKGRHLGSMDPVTGEMYKGPVQGRRLWK
jgi:hypothetical protein